jgi:hypothetical protein
MTFVVAFVAIFIIPDVGWVGTKWKPTFFFRLLVVVGWVGTKWKPTFFLVDVGWVGTKWKPTFFFRLLD